MSVSREPRDFRSLERYYGLGSGLTDQSQKMTVEEVWSYVFLHCPRGRHHCGLLIQEMHHQSRTTCTRSIASWTGWSCGAGSACPPNTA